MLGFLIGESPHPPGTEDTWLWDEARTITGKPMHRLLLKCCQMARTEDEMLRIAPDPENGPGMLGSLVKARSEVFKTICDRALKRGDVEFFRHLADCAQVVNGTPQKKPNRVAEPFKNGVIHAYELARIRAAIRKMPEPINGSLFGEQLKDTRPSWIDVREEMEARKSLPPGFLDRDVESQRKQVEDALKTLALPFAQKRQTQ